jgi:hypothetical protein
MPSPPSLFPRFVESCLSRSQLDLPERRLIAERLAFGNEADWQALDQIVLPPLLLHSDDPIVLALRRRVARDRRRVGARHRVAMESAHRRPLGFLRLALEEAWRLALRAPDLSEVDTVLRPVRDVLALADVAPAGEHPNEQTDFHTYGLLAVAHGQALGRQPDWETTWQQAIDATRAGSDDAEVQATALEVAAHGVVLGNGRNRFALANGWWRLALGLLGQSQDAAPDRRAELHVGYAAFLATHARQADARKHIRKAERLLAQVDPTWNEPLRFRLADLVGSS